MIIVLIARSQMCKVVVASSGSPFRSPHSLDRPTGTDEVLSLIFGAKCDFLVVGRQSVTYDFSGGIFDVH